MGLGRHVNHCARRRKPFCQCQAESYDTTDVGIIETDTNPNPAVDATSMSQCERYFGQPVFVRMLEILRE